MKQGTRVELMQLATLAILVLLIVRNFAAS